jgi:hypothetical protein
LKKVIFIGPKRDIVFLQNNIILNEGIVVRATAGIALMDIMQRQIRSNSAIYLA